MIERPERRSALVRPVGVVLAVVLGLGGVLLGVTVVLTPGTAPVGGQTSAPGQPVSPPASFSIPALGLTGKHLAELGHTREGRREQPGTAQGTGWFADGPAPGEPGVAVLAGHATYGYSGGAFARLSELNPGAEIVVRGVDGRESRFVVRKTARFAATDPDSVLIAPEGTGPELRLITSRWYVRLSRHLRLPGRGLRRPRVSPKPVNVPFTALLSRSAPAAGKPPRPGPRVRAAAG